MATGDIRNNLKILSAEIRSVKTPAAIVNLDGMMNGEADVYLPIYDYLFQWYSTKLANEILRRDLKLPPYKHNKTRFLETMYLVLRELFQWKPPLSTAQFFSTGFAEKKIIMCSNIIKLIKDYSGGMQRAAASHAGSSNSNSLRLTSLLHHLMEVQSSVKLLKDQMLLVMNQTESMLDKVLPVVTEIVDELYKKEAAEARSELESSNKDAAEGRGDVLRDKGEVLVDD
ncbi:hypothetical protein HPB47_028226 [Ixodes persulcatus]|uniref:Uncharacterized protein n=1 Tax=Ixodes persulcatus TaxID=34615 RepID=A0AC60PW33_IXOPE|nr:hypothetical protein HPB47_028226 [Ixodes persulcatus]